ncbi:hypothetical protein [Cycloclasticus sp. P1]|uniref:hypothetical protein n=1 Tax=Cycloclasticus sp. (strain P1) TaxID=385025 RepID=UPI000286A8E5|nr:hypothetical protein [Cycloclasticus sp. P1]AFT67245.1 hypothetical protein Q91_1208 [Cycloclasticus sp. P1]|tara:strand:+ start:545 stop:940 length:396 start_codon:yes stop_codon:yes gene_type:complete
MRKLFVFLLLLSASSYVYAFWSSYAYVSSVTESEFDLTVSVVHVDDNKELYRVRLKAVAYPYKKAWVITTPQSIPPDEQNQRARFWGKELSLSGVESIIPLRPTERSFLNRLDDTEEGKFYELLIPAEQVH